MIKTLAQSSHRELIGALEYYATIKSNGYEIKHRGKTKKVSDFTKPQAISFLVKEGFNGIRLNSGSDDIVPIEIIQGIDDLENSDDLPLDKQDERDQEISLVEGITRLILIVERLASNVDAILKIIEGHNLLFQTLASAIKDDSDDNATTRTSSKANNSTKT